MIHVIRTIHGYDVALLIHGTRILGILASGKDKDLSGKIRPAPGGFFVLICRLYLVSYIWLYLIIY